MEMVLVVLGVLAVMFVIERQRHERDLRLRAEQVRLDEERRRRRANRNA